MRLSTPSAFMALAISVCAVPITPSAPSLQRRAEQFRLQGLQEHEIAEKLTLPPTSAADAQSLPFLPHLSARIHALIHACTEDLPEHDGSGDIPPGSLEAPQILPRPTLVEPSALERLVAWLKIDDAEGKFAYEGKEMELRRPTGMRHWGAQDKWRLF